MELPTPIVTTSIPKKSFHRIRILLSLFVLALLVTGSFFFYRWYFQPEFIVARSLSNTFLSPSFLFDGSMKFDYKLQKTDGVLTKFPIAFSTAFTGIYTQSKTPSFSAFMAVSTADLPLAELQVKKVQEDLYFHVSNLSDLGFIDNSKVVGKWIKVPSETYPILEMEKTEDYRKKHPFYFTMAKNVFSVYEISDTEKIQGRAVTHYEIHPNRNAILTLLREGSYTNTTIESYMETIQFEKVEAWIDTNTEHLLRLYIKGYRVYGEVDAPKVSVEIDFSFKNFGEAPSIFVPKSSIPVSSLLKDIAP